MNPNAVAMRGATVESHWPRYEDTVPELVSCLFYGILILMCPIVFGSRIFICIGVGV